MKIALLICPSWSRTTPPFGLAMLKPYLERQGHTVIGLDVSNLLYQETSDKYKPSWSPQHTSQVWVKEEFVQEFVKENESIIARAVEMALQTGAEIIGFSLYFTTELMSLEIARRLKERKPSLFIVFGGPQGTRRKESLLRYPQVDAVIPGEGEGALSQLADNLQNHKSVENIQGAYVRANNPAGFGYAEAAPVQSLDDLPFADFTDFPVRDYSQDRVLPTYFSRGCFKKCVFCDVAFYWKNWRVRSGRRVFEEVKHQLERHPSVREFDFQDPILNADLKALEIFCDAVLAEKSSGNVLFQNIVWRGNAIVRYDLKLPLLQKMANAGCAYLQLGIESGSQKVLNSMKKGYTIPIAEKLLEDMQSVGVEAHINLMVGFPTESEEDFHQTLEFVRRNANHIEKIHPSEGFTTIDEGTYLREHAVDVFGVDDDVDVTYWSSLGGGNNYRVRLERYIKLCTLAEELDIELGEQYRKIFIYKDQLLQEFKEYERRKNGLRSLATHAVTG